VPRSDGIPLLPPHTGKVLNISLLHLSRKPLAPSQRTYQPKLLLGKSDIQASGALGVPCQLFTVPAALHKGKAVRLQARCTSFLQTLISTGPQNDVVFSKHLATFFTMISTPDYREKPVLSVTLKLDPPRATHHSCIQAQGSSADPLR